MRLLLLPLALIVLLLETGFKSDASNQLVWYRQLPVCPCKNPDYNGTKLDDGWARDKGNIQKYHRGAHESFRSYPFVKTSAGKSGQQCCYDQNGDLITNGRAAGTPDKTGVCKGENRKGSTRIRITGLVRHILKDVKPWNKYMKNDTAGWKGYNLLWRPDQGDNCKVNTL